MRCNSARPLASYPVLEIARRTLCSAVYYGGYLLLYVFYFKPRQLLRPLESSPADLA